MGANDGLEEAAAQAKAFRFDSTLLRIGAILVGVGGALGFVGAAVGGFAVAATVRQWTRQLDQPPRELAKLRWQQVIAAGAAGADAWRKGPPARASHGTPSGAPGLPTKE